VNPDWPLMRRILAILDGAAGMADTEIAERLGRSAADVRQAARILYRQHKVDFISGYLITVPQEDQGRRSA
jgi:hypothetical protein